jgi:hypothetical protein
VRRKPKRVKGPHQFTQEEQSMAKAPTSSEYSNTPIDLDEEAKQPTPHEVKVAKLAEKAHLVEPKRYDITSKNRTAPRVVHDVNRNSVVINPGETKKGVLLRPNVAEYLTKSDLTVVACEI